jgi:hypothetical protein
VAGYGLGGDEALWAFSGRTFLRLTLDGAARGRASRRARLRTAPSGGRPPGRGRVRPARARDSRLILDEAGLHLAFAEVPLELLFMPWQAMAEATVEDHARLAELRRSGALSEEEFRAAKACLLGPG